MVNMIEKIIDEYDHPMKNARRIRDIEEWDIDGDNTEIIEAIKKARDPNKIVEFNESMKILEPRKKEDANEDDVEHMHLTPNVTPRIKITAPLFYDGPIMEIFHEGSLMDTEQGAGDINETRKAPRAQDPESMARQMPRMSRTKSGKGTPESKPVNPKCPICRVSVTDYAKCPVCGRTVTKRFNINGIPIVVFNDQKDLKKVPKDRYVKPEIVNLYIKRKVGEKINKKYVAIRELDKKWLRDEEIGKFNFSGNVNKKSDGRCPRTGEIPHAKDPDRMSKFRHTPAFKLDFRVKMTKVDGKPVYGFNDIPVVKVAKELEECPECGCKVTLNEMRRGDKLCPKCGLVLGRVVFHLNPQEEED